MPAEGRQVLVGVVGEHHHRDHPGLVRDGTQRPGQRQPAARPGDDALPLVQGAAQAVRVVIGDFEDRVVRVRGEELGQRQRPPAADAGDVVAVGRVDADDLHLRVLFLQEPAGAGDRPAGAQGGDEVGHPALGLSPDLRAGGAVVRLRVGRVGVLVQLAPPRTRGQLLGLRHRSLGLAGHRAQRVVEFDQVRAEQPQCRPLLQRDGPRQGRGEAIATGVGDHRQADPGVARRRLDEVLQVLTAILGVGDQVRGDPVLDRAEGVVPLELGVDPGVFEAGVVQPHQWSRVVGVGQQPKDRLVRAQPMIHSDKVNTHG